MVDLSENDVCLKDMIFKIPGGETPSNCLLG